MMRRKSGMRRTSDGSSFASWLSASPMISNFRSMAAWTISLSANVSAVSPEREAHDRVGGLLNIPPESPDITIHRRSRVPC